MQQRERRGQRQPVGRRAGINHQQQRQGSPAPPPVSSSNSSSEIAVALCVVAARRIGASSTDSSQSPRTTADSEASELVTVRDDDAAADDDDSSELQQQGSESNKAQMTTCASKRDGERGQADNFVDAEPRCEQGSYQTRLFFPFLPLLRNAASAAGFLSDMVFRFRSLSKSSVRKEIERRNQHAATRASSVDNESKKEELSHTAECGTVKSCCSAQISRKGNFPQIGFREQAQY